MFVKGSTITPAVDAYAFGVLVWELTTASHAFEGEGAADARGWRAACCMGASAASVSSSSLQFGVCRSRRHIWPIKHKTTQA
jgi:hypothetical protein